MTEAELDELISDCPLLFHMAEEGSWELIAERGLLSTSALLDEYGIKGSRREEIELRHRPASVKLEIDNEAVATIRDQKPMSDNGLIRSLPAYISPADWYRTLNSKVFFWLTEERLNRLVGAREYRNKDQVILELDTRQVIERCREQIWLCPINSGCTKPFPHPRDYSTFSRIKDYPYESWRSKRKKGERVVELCVDDGVRNIKEFATRVSVRNGAEIVEVLWEA